MVYGKDKNLMTSLGYPHMVVALPGKAEQYVA